MTGLGLRWDLSGLGGVSSTSSVLNDPPSTRNSPAEVYTSLGWEFTSGLACGVICLFISNQYQPHSRTHLHSRVCSRIAAGLYYI